MLEFSIIIKSFFYFKVQTLSTLPYKRYNLNYLKTNQSYCLRLLLFRTISAIIGLVSKLLIPDFPPLSLLEEFYQLELAFANERGLEDTSHLQF